MWWQRWSQWGHNQRAGEKGMEGARQGARESEPAKDLVPTSLSLLAAVLHRWGACMGGGDTQTLISPLSPSPLPLYIGLRK